MNSSGDVQPAINIAYLLEYNFSNDNTGWYLRSGIGPRYKPCKDSSVFGGAAIGNPYPVKGNACVLGFTAAGWDGIQDHLRAVRIVRQE